MKKNIIYMVAKILCFLEKPKKTFIICAAVILSGCQLVNKPASVEQELAFSKFLRGVVYFENAQYRLRLCGATTIVNLSDPNQQLISHFVINDQVFPSKYVEFDASAIKALDWQLENLHFVSSKPKSCGADIDQLDYSITAKNGGWKADVSQQQVVVNKQDIYTKLTFKSNLQKVDKWRSSIVLPRGQKYTMELAVFEQECIDNTQQWHRTSATLKLNGVQYAGCARKGDSVKSFISGQYSNLLADGSAFIVLDLGADKAAALILDYRNGQPVLVNKGRWKMNANQLIEIDLVASDVSAEQSVMLFQIFNNHELRLKGFSEILGQTGLQLLPAN
jgi:uncharacterized membrane protein